MDDKWAVFCFRDTLFFERRSALARVPYLERWYHWQTLTHPKRAEWITNEQRLAQFLLRSKKRLTQLDPTGTLTRDIIQDAKQLAAVLAWARSDDMLQLTTNFSHDEMMRACDFLCAAMMEDPSSLDATKPYRLDEIVGWPRHVRGTAHRSRPNPFRVLARLILGLTPAALASLLEMTWVIR